MNMTNVRVISPKHGKGKTKIMVNDKAYILDDSAFNPKKTILKFSELMDAEEYEELIDELAKKISSSVNVVKLVKQGLYEVPQKELKAIKKEMEKDKPRIRNNEGCFFLSVGKTHVGLRD